MLLSDEKMQEIDDKYCGLDRELSKKLGMQVYKSTGDPVTANREKVKAQLKKVGEPIDIILEGWRDTNSIQVAGILGQLRELRQVLLKEIE